jgi:hypothetical protein
MRSNTVRSPCSLIITCAVAAILACGVANATAQVQQNSGPTYQGRLSENGQPANGAYDIRITPTNPTGVTGTTTTHLSVQIVDGVFSIPNAFVVPNSDLFNQIRIEVRPAGSAQAFTVLSPNQPISPAPFSLVTRGIQVDGDNRVGIGLPRTELNARLHVADNNSVLALSPEPPTGSQEPTNDVVSISFFGNYPEDGTPSDAQISYVETPAEIAFSFAGERRLTLARGPSYTGEAILGNEQLQLLGLAPRLTLTPIVPVSGFAPIAGIELGSATTGGQANMDWYPNSGLLVFDDPSVPGNALVEYGVFMDVAAGRLGLNDAFTNDPNSTLSLKAQSPTVALKDIGGDPSTLRFESLLNPGEAEIAFLSGPATLEFDVDKPGTAPLGLEMSISPEVVTVWSQLVVLPTAVDGYLVGQNIQNSDDILVIEADAVLGLYSTNAGTYGSQINLKEVLGTDAISDNWSLLRETSSFGSSLVITYGASPNGAINPKLVEVDPVEGSLRLGGAGATASDYRLVLPNVASGSGRAVANRWDTYSSARFKTNIATIANPLVTLTKLRGVTFDWTPGHAPIEGPAHDMGFIAEEVAAVLPEAVSTDSEGRAEALDYSRLLPIAIEAIKQQQQTIDAQRAEIEALNERLIRIEKMLDR